MTLTCSAAKSNLNRFFQTERVEYDAVQYFADAGLGSADDVIMTDDQQKLIKVFASVLWSLISGKRQGLHRSVLPNILVNFKLKLI